MPDPPINWSLMSGAVKLFLNLPATITKPVRNTILRWVAVRRLLRRLHDLDSAEKPILEGFIGHDVRVRELVTSGPVEGLVSAGILEPLGTTVGLIARNRPFKITDRAWVHLKKHPELLR